MAPSRKHGPPPSFSVERDCSDAIPAQSARDRAIAFEPIDPLADPAWDEAVLAHPDATIFHSSAWARVLAHTYGHRPAYFRLTRNGVTEALAPIMEVRSRLTGCRGVCLPFSDFCGPLLSPEADEELLYQHLTETTGERGWKYLEIRVGRGPGTHASTPEPCFFAHQLDLRGTREQIQSGFSSSVRRALRKAGDSGVTTRISTSWDAMLVFHRLHLATRRRHGVPPQPLAFFRNIQQEVLASGHGFLVIAEHEDRPLAAAVFLRFGSAALYKFGASDHGAWELRPNNLAMAGGIFTLAEQGAQTLHFGRTDSEQEGLRRFKRQWGAKETGLSYQKFEPNSAQWLRIRKKSTGLANAVVRLLPSAASRSLGRLLYPHLD